MKAFITEIRMELESSRYCVWLLSYLYFCVAEPAKPPLHKILWQVCNTDESFTRRTYKDQYTWAHSSVRYKITLYDLVLA